MLPCTLCIPFCALWDSSKLNLVQYYSAYLTTMLEAVQFSIKFSGLSCSVPLRIIVYYSETLTQLCSSVACIFEIGQQACSFCCTK